ncbi:hypothetical protein EV193_12123 [Herbihabitans rhizosphaerae]|uniref:VOC domain-containing protein n=1 Tax=Herbihabitans rhizosphaerae TaxID=1872711 RepID=A0A4Q7KE67_9PSEU|nr:VOC family protein [Herbihabitans rhizosphaerae]RZS29480.1 hypothetical protein EV193_12123 [Herbihabitans rhizosphaerae]
MSRKTFLNLPVNDLPKAVEFFTSLGFSFNKDFTDENATCMVISDESYVMLLVKPFFESFASKPLADVENTTGAIVGLSADSREEVDELVGKALAAGAHEPKKDTPQEDFMYGRSFIDLDGHHWEIMWMDPNFVPHPA